MDTFRRYIQRRMAELGINQSELARRAGKTEAWASKFMSGERKEMKVNAFLALAKALEVNPMKLILAYEGKDPNANEEATAAEWIRDLKERVPDIRKLLELLEKTEPGRKE